VARYGQRYKDRIVARLLPPESAAIDLVAREVGISVATLERWRVDALANGSAGGGSQRWTAAARLQAVIVTAAMDEATRSAWCREQGLYPAELDAWKRDLARAANHEDRCYRWPLGQGLTVEVRFFGCPIEAAHIDLLREYLDLFKTALG